MYIYKTSKHCIDFLTLKKNHQTIVIYSDFIKPDLHPLTSRSKRIDSVVLRKGDCITLTGRYDI